MYQLELTEEQIKNLHEYGNDSTQDFLKEKFPNLFKNKTAIDSLEKAITYLGDNDEEVVKLYRLQGIKGLEKYVAKQSLVVWFRAVNDKYNFDWSKGSSEHKYFGWWIVEDNEIRFGVVNYCYSYTDTSLRLCTKTEDQYLELKDNKEFCFLMKTYILG